MPGLCFGAHELDDVLRKVGVEFASVVGTIGAVCAVGSHYSCVTPCVNREGWMPILRARVSDLVSKAKKRLRRFTRELSSTNTKV